MNGDPTPDWVVLAIGFRVIYIAACVAGLVLLIVCREKDKAARRRRPPER